MRRGESKGWGMKRAKRRQERAGERRRGQKNVFPFSIAKANRRVITSRKMQETVK
jgi:hypothetical protein